MKKEYNIDWMFNYKVYVGPSDIHGVGLRAIKPIKKGEEVYYYKGEDTHPVSKSYLLKKGLDQRVIDTLCRLYYHDEHNLYLQPNQQLFFVNFLNHSANPNMVFKSGIYIAKRDIEQDEEVTLDWLDNGYHPKLYFKPNEND